jgi:transposase-like protein
VPWQRCQFHLQQNAQRYVPRRSMKRTVAADIRSIFNAPNEIEAKRLLDHFIQRYETTAPKLASWAENAIPEGFSVFDLPELRIPAIMNTDSGSS